jgi:hypothetical protein
VSSMPGSMRRISRYLGIDLRVCKMSPSLARDNAAQKSYDGDGLMQWIMQMKQK